MGNSLRCCLACILPCGALDVIRIVHLNGHVEELSHSISVKQVLAANPSHVLSQPCSPGMGRKILILSPKSDLKRGHIYFLIPTSSLPEKIRTTQTKASSKKKAAAHVSISDTGCHRTNAQSGKKVSRRGRQCGRLGIWRPHLESIYEDL